MSKEILLSVKDVYAQLLVSGAKKIELRRRFPIEIEKGTKLWIYSSGGSKVIIGSCLVEKVHKLKLDDLWKVSCVDAMVSWEDFSAYFYGIQEGYAIYVQSPQRLENPMFLTSLHSDKKINRPPQSFCYM